MDRPSVWGVCGGGVGDGLLKSDFMTSKSSLLYREASGPEIFHVNLEMHALVTDAFLSSQVTPASPSLRSTSTSTPRFHFIMK